MSKHSSLRKRRIYRARKIAHRKIVARSISYFNQLLNRKSGCFADRLTYHAPKLFGISYHDRQKLDSINNKEEDYYNEGLCEY